MIQRSARIFGTVTIFVAFWRACLWGHDNLVSQKFGQTRWIVVIDPATEEIPSESLARGTHARMHVRTYVYLLIAYISVCVVYVVGKHGNRALI